MVIVYVNVTWLPLPTGLGEIAGFGVVELVGNESWLMPPILLTKTSLLPLNVGWNEGVKGGVI